VISATARELSHPFDILPPIKWRGEWKTAHCE